jgi:hypothetical protein
MYYSGIFLVAALLFSCMDYDYYNENISEYTSKPILMSLDISSGTLTPEFNSKITKYSLSIESSIDEITLYPVPQLEKSDFYFYLGEVPIGQKNECRSLPLQYGDNLVKVKIIGVNKRINEYTLTVNRFNPSVFGNVLIKDTDDLKLLYKKSIIDGDLTIDSVNSLDMLNLEALNFLTIIRGDLNIINNKYLEDTYGFKNLAVIEGDFNIINNEKLKTVSGFDSLHSIEGDINISYNGILESLDDLNSLIKSFNGNITINTNAQLISINCFQNFYGNIMDVKISGNTNLTEINSFQNILQINSLIISNNLNINRIEMRALVNINNDLTISLNNNLTSLNFPNLETVQGLFTIRNNSKLLTSIAYDLCSQVNYDSEYVIEENKL